MNFPVETLEVPEHLAPVLRISPFDAAAFSFPPRRAAGKPGMLRPTFWLDDAASIRLMRSGRAALRAILRELGLRRHDSVLILTTSGGPYISSCVTDTIEAVCRWSRAVTGDTRAVLLIHEFGFPAAVPAAVRRLGLPLIEDCAYALGTRACGGKVGACGDYALYSLSKFFPVPFGGILVSRRPLRKNIESVDESLSRQGSAFLTGSLSAFAPRTLAWSQARRAHARLMSRALAPHGIRAYFTATRVAVPGVFVARVPDHFDAAAAKARCLAAGIECTEYYGQGGFLLPVHQSLSTYQIRYMLHHFLASTERTRHG